MREIRTVLVMVPPLLADLIRQVVAVRALQLAADLSIIAEIDDSEDIPARLEVLAPDLVILGPAAAPFASASAFAPGPRVLTLSPDLACVFGPNPGDIAPLTPDSLARLVRVVSQTI